MNAAAVKLAVDPVEFFRYELGSTMPPPKRRGWVDGGLCPFHQDRHAGSFKVNVDTGAFICFACGVKGHDIVAFTQRRHGLTFKEALAYLRERIGY